MRNKLVGVIRKYYEYKILPDGKVVTRSKRTNIVTEYQSIEEYVRDVSYTDMLIERLFSFKWNNKKKTPWTYKQTTGVIKDSDYWNAISVI